MNSITKSVTKILREQFNIDARPGQKITCPFCGHNSFSIKSDDSFAKCFYPECGKRLFPKDLQNKHIEKLSLILDGFCEEAHSKLMRQPLTSEKNALDYLLNERKIHQEVVTQSHLGILPKTSNLQEQLSILISEISNDLSKLNSSLALDGTSKEDKKRLRKDSTLLEEILDPLKGALTILHSGKYIDWLCFFYTNHTGNITAIRLRRPYSKDFALMKFSKNMGVFGLTLTGDNAQLTSSTIVVEGEINLLQMQSLTKRRSEQFGSPCIYQNAIAVGSATTPDLECVKNICPTPLFLYDNDQSLAGYKLVENALNLFNCYVSTTPEIDSDLDSYIVGFKENIELAWQGFENIIKNHKFLSRNFTLIKQNVTNARLISGKGVKELSIQLSVLDIIRTDTTERGKFYRSNSEAYLFLNAEKKLIKISLTDNECVKFFSKYGIISTEKIFHYIFEAIRIYAIENGQDTIIQKFSYYNSTTNILYVQNGESSLLKISYDEITLSDNGTDGVLFLANRLSTPFNFVPCPLNISYINSIILNSINFSQPKLGELTIGQRKMSYYLWNIANYFRSILPTRPILAVVGPKGSSKTSCVRRAGKLIIGPDFDVTPLSDKPDDFDAAVTNLTFVGIDNADSKCSWFNDKLAVLATGGKYLKRKLYTTNSMEEIEPDCFLAITSRTPHFKRDDVNDRLLIMFVDRIEKFISERTLNENFLNHRDEMMSELMLHLQTVVRALKDQSDVHYEGPFRMADFADFALKIGTHLGFQNEIHETLSKLGREQSRFTLEDDPVARMLILWVAENDNIEISNIELCQKLSLLAKQKNMHFPFTQEQGKSFAQYMSSLRPNLEDFFEITPKNHGGHRVTYTYKLKSKEDL